MLDHVAISVRDLEASRKFHEPLFERLGAKVVMEWLGLALFGTDDGMVALRQSDEVMPMHVAFRADRSAVDSFYETALAAGASDNGASGHPVRPPRELLRGLRHRPGWPQHRSGLPPTRITFFLTLVRFGRGEKEFLHAEEVGHALRDAVGRGGR
jgi:catechol 2,3-dioxygenase-like lactoylglutathione lyase family enzyme